MAGKNRHGTASGRREIAITRILNAPRNLVFEVWTNPDHIKHWWGPEGFTNTIHTMEVKEGGEWDFIMHGPDGTDYKNRSIFTKVLRPALIEFDHVSGPTFHAVITFAEQGKKTLLTWRMIFPSAEALDKVIKEQKADKGLTQNVDKLEDYLRGMTFLKTKDETLRHET